MPVIPPTTSGNRGQMLFLVGHGLQTPLSAIRWGCSRLKKISKRLTKEEAHVLENIQTQAKVLADMVNALLFVARTEDGTYSARLQDIYLHDFLVSFAPLKEVFPDRMVHVSCPEDLLIKADRKALECLLEAVSVIMGSGSDKKNDLTIEVQTKGRKGYVSMNFLPELELSFLRDASVLENGSSPQIVGGTPGLMLSVITSLCKFMGGFVHVKKQGESHHLLSLELPMQSVASTIFTVA